MSRWTPEQQAAIDARGASVVVSAAAGSGKTSVLVERLIRLLSDTGHPCPAERMVVVTFTRDAAGEVRTRLNRALTSYVLQKPDDPWLRRQQTMLQSAKISTIHSFCFDLLREQFAALNISAGFRIMEPAEESTLRSTAAAAVLERFSAAAAEDETVKAQQKLLLDAFCTQDDTPLERIVLALYGKAEETPFGESLLSDAAALYESGEMQKRMAAAIAAELDTVCMYYNKAVELGRELDAGKNFAVICDEAAEAEKLRTVLAEDGFARLSELIAAKPDGRLSRAGKNVDAEKWAAVKALRDKGKALRDNLRKKWAAALRFADSDFVRHGAVLRALDRLVRDFSEELAAQKLAKNAVGFGDVMRMTLSLLAERDADGNIHKTPLAEQLSQQYEFIMIDEFQDADNQQDLIFRMLSRGGNAERCGSNLFTVGDSKQCIYRFRNANPNNFSRAMRESAEYTSPMLTENTCIRLNKNFRSAQEIVDFVNLIFSQLMTRQIGEIDYDESQKLVRGAEYPEADRPVELLLLENSREAPADEPRAVAERIAMHLSAHTPVRTADGSVRPCAPKDFLLLIRSKTHVQEYAAALTERGIPVCRTEQSGYLKSPEIMLLLDILRAVDNPLLDIPAAAAMLSPMIGFTLDELTAVRVYDRKHSLFQTMQKMLADAAEGNSQTDTPLLQKCRRFCDFLESMRLCSAMETPEQLIRRVYRQTDFLGMMQMTQGGEQKKANLRALIAHAKAFEQSSGGGLSAFLRYVDALLSRGQDLEGGGVPAGTENVVQIKTIHASKGLEAPFVILVRTDDIFTGKDAKEPFQYHAELGLAFRLHDPELLTAGVTLPYLAILQRSEAEMRSEELRLLYVALTRAKEHLILPVTHSAKYGDTLRAFAAEQDAFGGQSDSLTGSVTNMRDWLMCALIRNPACEMLRREFDLTCGSDPSQPLISVRIDRIEPEDADAAAQDGEQDAAAESADPALTERLKAQCAWKYESREAHLTAKYGVSELAKAEDFSAPLRRPQFVREKHGLSGAERGTAVHTFLQYADFSAAAKDVPAEITRLREKGRLTAKQADAVSRSGISAFFETALYARICNAKQVWREKKFTVRLSDLTLTGPLAQLGSDYAGTDGMVTGIMDLVFEEADGIVLADYKTDRVQRAEDLLGHYTEQIRLYAEALRLLMQKPVKACFLYSLTLNRTVPVIL
ncbi:MAG: helicase-exonuclease AddAB subunit AddA [Oscillospiraceae bacterium]|nr:helicase-exonuclease AddAB subunit AddA [Oscillospiraceae bacterium]